MSDREQTVDVRSIEALHPPEALTLLFFQRDGSQFGVRRVPVGARPLVVGRASDADVMVDDRSLSRHHARLALREGRLWIEDLGSRNGTVVNGDRLDAPRALEVGDAVTLGRIDLEIRGGSTVRATEVDDALVGHDDFRRALERELVRAQHLERPLSLVLIKAGRAAGRVARASWQSQLAAACAPIDVCALYSQAVLELLLPEADATTAEARATQLVQHSGEKLCAAVCSAARVDSADAMLERALAALGRSSEASPVQHAPRAGGEASGDDAPASPPAGEHEIPELTRHQEKLSRAHVTLLLFGETGSGKEVMARRIHRLSPRGAGPFVVLDCGAVPRELMESTLFGSVEGAFTGARDRAGCFARADGGTLLLDEIGELPLELQPKLLRVLDGSGFSRVGTTDVEHSDVRVLAATHRDLREMVQKGTFREDLFQRLGGTIELPPLRRYPRVDFDALVRRFIARAATQHDAEARDVDRAALDLLAQYRWPGNVRELKNEIERAVIIAEGDKITVDDISSRVVGAPAERAPATSSGEGRFWDQVRKLQIDLIRGALARNEGNRSAAARELELSRRTLTYMLSKYGIS